MSENRPTKIANKYCDTCGQKNYRPHRSLKELFAEFVEDWLGYDSKLFQTLKALFIPARLSKDYFANSNHKNHYITPIRLYLLLSVIFFILTNFAGFNITEIDLDSPQVQVGEADTKSQPQVSAVEEVGNAIENAEHKIKEELNAKQQQAVDEATAAVEAQERRDGVQFSIAGDNDFNSKSGCLGNSDDMFNLWPEFLDAAVDKQVGDLCQSYDAILHLPKEEQRQAKGEWGLNLGQAAIESIPQTFFLTLPLLALVLGLFYISRKKKHIYVEHLVLLMHSHSFIFASSLLYLGWFRLEESFPWLQNLQMDIIFPLLIVVYLYLTQKWFYQKGWWATLWRLCLFGLLYFFIVGLAMIFGTLIGILSA